MESRLTNIGCDLATCIISSMPNRTGVVHALLHVAVTSNIDLDSMKYKGSLILGFVYTIGWFHHGLVRNPKDRFSHDGAA